RAGRPPPAGPGATRPGHPRPGRPDAWALNSGNPAGHEFRRGSRLPRYTRSTPRKENIMTATYTFDVFSSLDGFGTASGNWGGYWGKQGPELLDRRLALYSE